MGIEEYCSNRVEGIIKQYGEIFDEFEKNIGGGVLIYGAGFVGTWAAKYLTSLGIKVKYFIDKDSQKWGEKLLNIEIISPNDNRIAECPFILIAARHAIETVLNRYQDTEYLVMSFEGYYCMKHYQDYEEVRDYYLIDEKSIYTYNALLCTMLTGKTEHCLKVMEKDMYFSLPEFSGTFNEIFVDAGAFVGDSIERFIWENLGTFRHIYAFEPGEKQFNALSKRMERLYEEWGIDPERVTLVKAGLSNESSMMSCLYEDDYALRYTLNKEAARNTIKTYSLDEFLDGKEISFLKVDIEGMEMKLLEGAQNTIRKYKPKMALCVYHYPCDLYSIAKYVRKISPEYKFKLRLHAPFFGDFVLYCY